MTRSSASIRTSEPAYKAPVSQWQRDNMGRVEPMQDPAFMVGQTGWRQALAVMAIVLVVVVVMVTR